MLKENSKPKKSDTSFIIQEEMKKINISNDALKPIEPQIDIISMFQKFKEIMNNKESDWTLQVGMINYLRRLHKFEKAPFYQYFFGTKFYLKLIELINSLRTSVSKNVLLFLKEIFSNEVDTPENYNLIQSLIEASLPLIISKVNSNQSFIKEESKLCVESIVKNYKNYKILSSFLKLMISKNSTQNKIKEKETDYIINLCVQIITNLGKELNKVENDDFHEFLKNLVCLYESNKIVYAKYCHKMLNSLVDMMEKEIFYSKVDSCSKKEKDAINLILEYKDKETKKQSSKISSMKLRKDLVNRKKTFNLSKIQNVSIDKGKKTVTIKFIPKTKVNDKKSQNLEKIQRDENAQINY